MQLARFCSMTATPMGRGGGWMPPRLSREPSPLHPLTRPPTGAREPGPQRSHSSCVPTPRRLSQQLQERFRARPAHAPQRRAAPPCSTNSRFDSRRAAARVRTRRARAARRGSHAPTRCGRRRAACKARPPRLHLLLTPCSRSPFKPKQRTPF